MNYFLLRRLVPRCAVAFKENHRPQELRVLDIEAGGVSGVPAGKRQRRRDSQVVAYFEALVCVKLEI